MLTLRRLFSTSLLAFFAVSTFAEPVHFINDNVSVALDRAAREGKLIMLDFWADYCSPCKLMEQYTFTDANVVEQINNNYIPVRINIQSFDGYDLKQQYNIKILPTIIILDSKGRQVARYEESMPPSRLVTILETHNEPKNRQKFAAAPVSVTYTAPTALDGDNYTSSNDNKVIMTSKPTTTPSSYNNTPTKKPSPNVEKPLAYTPPARSYSDVSKPTTAARKPTKSTTAKPTTPTAKPATKPASNTLKSHFTIQIGNFTRKDYAAQAGDKLTKRVDRQQKAFLLEEETKGVVHYKSMIGSFKTRQEALNFKQKNHIEGFVISRATFLK